ARVIRAAITRRDWHAVSIARPLIANRDLVHMFAQGRDRAPRPCTYCNKCVANVLENPLGCYEESRFDSREQMLRQVMSVFEPPADRPAAPPAAAGVGACGTVSKGSTLAGAG